jgi:hypothetical protein
MLALVKTEAAVCASPRRREVSSTRVARAVAVLRVAAVAVLLVFHAVLLWTHLLDGRLFEPAVALRWTIGFVLLAVIAGFRRIGVPLFWGRRALVVWVLVALLHVGAATPATSTSLTGDDPAGMALSLVVLPPTAGILFTSVLLLLGVLLARGFRSQAPAAARVRRDRPARLRSELLRPRLAPRAPPQPVSC